jgi:RNA polymerase sigma factor (sigma-70 family)
MPELDDIALLRQYAEDNSESAFATLAEKYVNLVYSTALRSAGNAQAAEEITQAVFIILARRARSLSQRTILSGWLYQTARLTAANFLRGEIRRQKREQEAYMQSTLNEAEPEVWPQIAPHLEAAMTGLSEKDRNAIVLRFFENKSLGEVGSALGANEAAAKMRVNRALEKLRNFFSKRGIVLSAPLLAGAISANSVHAAPVGLAVTVTATAAKGSAVATSTLTLVKGALKLMAWTKMKTAAVTGAVVLLTAGTTTIAVKEFAGHGAPKTQGGPVEMKITWIAGREYPMHIEMDQTVTTDVPGRPQSVVQGVNLTQDFDFSALKPLDNGGWQLELKFDSETLNVSQGGRNVMSFASAQSAAQDAGDPAAPILRAMIGTRIQYFTDAKGEVEKLEGVDELKNRINAVAQPQEQAVFNELFSEDTLKQYGSFAEAMPNRTVALGESWQLKKDLSSSIGVLTLDMKYTFKNWEQHDGRQCAHVEEEGKILTKSISTATGMAVEITNGEILGEFWYDPALGMIVDVDNHQNMALKITTRAQTMTSQISRQVRLALLAGQ